MSYRKNGARARRRQLQPFYDALFHSRWGGQWSIPVGVQVPTPTEWGRKSERLAFALEDQPSLLRWIEDNFIYSRDAGSTPAADRVIPGIVVQHDGRIASWVAPSGERGVPLFFGNTLSVTTRGVYWQR